MLNYFKEKIHKIKMEITVMNVERKIINNSIYADSNTSRNSTTMKKHLKHSATPGIRTQDTRI